MTWSSGEKITAAKLNANVPTREIFIPVTLATEMVKHGSYPSALIDHAGDYGAIVFRIPHDFTALSFVRIIFISKATAEDMYLNVDAHHGAVGEAYNVHSDTQWDSNIGPVVENQLHLKSISLAFSPEELAANDLVGVNVWYDEAPTATNISLLGVWLRYS